MDEMSLYISSAYAADPEKDVNMESSSERFSDSALLSLKMGVASKRKRSSFPKKFSKSGNQNIDPKEAGRRRTCRANDIDGMELCAKRMKNMFLNNEDNGVNPFGSDDGYEADSEC